MKFEEADTGWRSRRLTQFVMHTPRIVDASPVGVRHRVNRRKRP